MASEELQRDGNLDEVHSRLNESLKSCRTMVSNYRALLKADSADAMAREDAAIEEASNDP